MDQLLGIVILLTMFSLAAGDGSSYGYDGRPTEYCERDSFKAKCQENQVLKITRALYGRMRVGKCVQRSFGMTGCQDDVMHVVDTWCSGRNQCTFPVSKLKDYAKIDTKVCPSDLLRYLEASYECIQVASCPDMQCRRSHAIPLYTHTGHLANPNAIGSDCGTHACPWKIKAEEGKRINISVTIFASPLQVLDDKEFPQHTICPNVATIKEGDNSQDIILCQSDGKEKQIYFSNTNAVEIVMQKQKDPQIFFIMTYEVIGCQDFVPPKYTDLKKEGNYITVTCNTTSTKWSLYCDGRDWQGEVGTCLAPKGESWNLSNILTTNQGTPKGLLVVIGMGVALGIILGFVMLSVALVFIRRRHKNNGRTLMQPVQSQQPEYDLCPAQPQKEIDFIPDLTGCYIEKTLCHPVHTKEGTYSTKYITKTPLCHTLKGGTTTLPPEGTHTGHIEKIVGLDGTVHFREHVYESPQFEQTACMILHDNLKQDPAIV